MRFCQIPLLLTTPLFPDDDNRSSVPKGVAQVGGESVPDTALCDRVSTAPGAADDLVGQSGRQAEREYVTEPYHEPLEPWLSRDVWVLQLRPLVHHGPVASVERLVGPQSVNRPNK